MQVHLVFIYRQYSKIISMNKLNESEYEKTVIEYAEAQGFEHMESDKVYTLRRGSLVEVLLRDHLEEFLQKNKELSQDMISEVIRKVSDLKSNGSIEESNRIFQKYITEGVKVRDKKKQRDITVRLFEKGKNKLVVTNQFLMASNSPKYKNQKPDVILYINGMPISVIELKNPTDERDDTLERAYRQIENYKLYLPSLFVYNIFNIISDGNISKVGSLTASLARYQNWRGSDFNSPESSLFKDLLKEETILKLAENYSFYKEGNPAVKIIAGYHQFYGVQAMIDSVENAMIGDKKGGLFWHTQGSGKSFSMMFFVKNLAKIKPGTTFVVVTDRNDLDNQLFSTFKSSSKFIGQKIEQINSIKELKEEIAGRKQDGVYFSTVQKFTEEIGELIDRDNMIVISDEAHRSHNNVDGKYEIDLENSQYIKKYGSAKYLRDAFPNATFLGFTGTPIETDDRSTSSIFGNIVSEYKMTNAENDGVIVPINYESRQAKLQFDQEKLRELDEEDEKFGDLVMSKSILPTEVKKKRNKFLKELKHFVGDKDRIEGIVQDLVKHYESRCNMIKGKAMIVALNRHVALEYYEQIIRIRPEWKNKVKLVVTTNGQHDDPRLQELGGSSQDRKKRAIEFKDENSEFKIAIVVDMWLTGFDVPALDTLYLDKPIKMHNLMQTIARTNRVYSNKKEGIIKTSGLIVDYIGIWNKLGEALAFYSGNAEQDEIVALHDLQMLKKDYIKHLLIIWNNYGLDKLGIDTSEASKGGAYMFDAVDSISNTILKNKKQNEFVTGTKTVSKWIKNVVSILEPEEVMLFQLLISARLRMIKLSMDDIDFIGHKDRMLDKLEDAIKYEKTIIIDKVNDNQISLRDILKFVELHSDKNEELNAQEKKSAVRTLIKEVGRINIIKASKLSDELHKLMSKYDSSHITIEELIHGLVMIAQQANETIQENSRDSLTAEQKAFFEILINPIEQNDFDKEQIEKILEELLVIINNDKLVNKQWAFNETLIKKTKGHLKKLLKKYGYPPEKSGITKNKIVDQIMKMKGINQYG